MNGETPGIRYEAFLSYARADERDAVWLHRALEQYRIPRSLATNRRFRSVFRDRDELASSIDLSETLTEAIAQSANLIGVDEEVRTFRELQPAAPIVCVLAAGDPDAPESVFPPSLLEGTVPLAIDLRHFRRDRKAALLRGKRPANSSIPLGPRS